MPAKRKPQKPGSALGKAQRNFVFNSQTEFSPVKREDVFDAAHILEQLEPVIDYLKNWQVYQQHQVPFDGGVVIYGPAGTGKTLIARYIASVSGARFLDMRKFPVKMASQVHAWQPEDVTNLFRLSAEWVQKNGHPMVIFLDQFDDWLEVHKNVTAELETVTAGFSKRPEGIVLIVTSKKSPDKVGSSLFRRGRIGIHIACSRPDTRQQIILLRGFLGRYAHDANIDCRGIVAFMDEPTPANIENNVAEAAGLALREHRLRLARGEHSAGPLIAEKHLLRVFLSRALDAPDGHNRSRSDLLTVCIHEIGHAAVARALGLTVLFASHRSGLRSDGLTSCKINTNRQPTFEEIKHVLAMYCGGMEAEKFFDLPPSGNSGTDVANLCADMEEMIGNGYRSHRLATYGLQDVIREYEDAQPRSAEMGAAYEAELAYLSQEAQEKARNILLFFGKEFLQKVAETLLQKDEGVLLGKELDTLLEPKLSEYHAAHNIRDFAKEQD